VVPNHCPSCGGKITPADLQRGACGACGGHLVIKEPVAPGRALTNRGVSFLVAGGLVVVAVLLAFVAYWALQVFDTRDAWWPPYLCLLPVLSLVGAAVQLVQAFQQERREIEGNLVRITTYLCPYCHRKVDYSQLPAFGGELLCPNCGLAFRCGGEEGSSAPTAGPGISLVSIALGLCPRCDRFDGLGGKFCMNCGKELAGGELDRGSS
jgi:predicted amidophosphoribosyltransferase